MVLVRLVVKIVTYLVVEPFIYDIRGENSTMQVIELATQVTDIHALLTASQQHVHYIIVISIPHFLNIYIPF